jgi:hypothetical protein
MNAKIFLCLPLFVFFTFGLCGCEKDRLDKQMAELCQKDGGSRVYEKVVLPAEMFDELGRPLLGWGKHEGKLDKSYMYVHEEKILKNGDPFKGKGQLFRFHDKIIRRSDDKLLGEEVYYHRAGGDGFYIGHYTQKMCPETTMHIDRMVFIKK